MKSLKGTKTEKNLMAAFVGESAARNKYTFFASVAKKEGYEQISAIFQETADNEKEHAKRFYKFLGDATVAVDSVYSSGLADTAACLKWRRPANMRNGPRYTPRARRRLKRKVLPR